MELTAQTIELDVREELRNKRDPFKLIMDAVKSLNKEDTLILHATLKPVPLFGIMKLKGYVHKAEKLDSEHWVVTFLHKSRKQEWTVTTGDEAEDELEVEIPSFAGPRLTGTAAESQVMFLDNRGLEPPQPMVRTLNKLKEIKTGDELIIHNDRVPVFLIEELNTLGYSFTIDEQTDGTARIHIFKK